jgi:hypothetical protein
VFQGYLLSHPLPPIAMARSLGQGVCRADLARSRSFQVLAVCGSVAACRQAMSLGPTAISETEHDSDLDPVPPSDSSIPVRSRSG